jgi:peptide/nickel transport system ATP-binding protein
VTELLTINDLRVSYGQRRGLRNRSTEVLHGLSLAISGGETLGLVGESGSGKTTIGRAILGLVRPSAGTIAFCGQNITQLSARARRKYIARDIQVVFQDPYTSLNPAMMVADILTEPLTANGRSARESRAAVNGLLDQVGLPADAGRRLPREFSGGQRQRIAIARALAVGPKLIVCDEPVSALDLSTQARVLDLLIAIQESTDVAYLFVSHDLAVVRHISHRVAVLYRGEIVETGSARKITWKPEHPYTQRLLASAPVADPILQQQRREEWRRLAARGEFENAAMTMGQEATGNPR